MLKELFFTFFKVGATTFGGGYAMMPLLDQECVEKKHWLTPEEFLELTVIAESTPGPLVINCATYTGYKVAGLAGALAATAGIILPSFLLLLLITEILERALQNALVIRAFRGLQVAVAFLIVRAALTLLRRMQEIQKLTLAQYILFFASLGVMLLGSLLGVHISVILLVVVSGFFGYFFCKQRGDSTA